MGPLVVVRFENCCASCFGAADLLGDDGGEGVFCVRPEEVVCPLQLVHVKDVDRLDIAFIKCFAAIEDGLASADNIHGRSFAHGGGVAGFSGVDVGPGEARPSSMAAKHLINAISNRSTSLT